MNSKILQNLGIGIAINLSLFIGFSDFSKFQLTPPAIAQTSNSSILGCWITSINSDQRLTLTIYSDNTWESEVKFDNFFTQAITGTKGSSGQWYAYGSQLVTESESGARGRLALLSPYQLQWGEFSLRRCN
jgi:hypothetical protein